MDSLEVKQKLGRLLDLTRADRLLRLGQSLVWGSRHLRAVNYHDVPAGEAASFAAHLQHYRERYCPVGEAELEDFFRTGRWDRPRPGLIVSFDDGLRSHYEVAAPLLEEYGFVGWFMVPAGFVATPVEEQRRFCREHRIELPPGPDGERVALTPEGLRDLAGRGHVVACHTLTHRRLYASTPPEELRREIVEARELLQGWLGREVSSFCWVGGEEETYSSAAAALIRDTGYRFSFMTNAGAILPRQDPLQCNRINIEAGWPLEVVRLQLDGIIDLKYLAKRRRVNRLTAR